MRGFSIGIALVLSAVLVPLAAQEAANRYPFAKGKIERIDVAAKQIILRTPRGLAQFQVTPKSRLHAGLERLELHQLQPGNLVAIHYTTNATGQAVINRLKIVTPIPDDLEDKTQ